MKRIRLFLVLMLTVCLVLPTAASAERLIIE